MGKQGCSLLDLMLGLSSFVVALLALYELVVIGRQISGVERSGQQLPSVPYQREGVHRFSADCTRKCGDVDVPYPFGFTPECAQNPYFVLKCTQELGANLSAKDGGPWPLLTYGSGTYTVDTYNNTSETDAVKEYTVDAFQVEKIDPGFLTINATAIKAMRCDEIYKNGTASIFLNDDSPYMLSSYNQFFVAGCNSFGQFNTTGGTNGISIARSSCGPISCVNQHVNDFCGPYDCCVQPIPESKAINLSGGGYCGFCSILYPSTFQAVKERSEIGNQLVFGTYGLRIDWYIPPTTSSSTGNCSAVSADEQVFECSQNANCQDGLIPPYGVTYGYYCRCDLQGYEGDGYKKGTGCKDTDECQKRTANCTTIAQCENLPGSYKCICPFGMEGNGLNRTLNVTGTGCTWIDKCQNSSLNDCSKDAKCTFNDSDGTFTCTCQGGTVGNGHGKNGCKEKVNSAAIIGGTIGGVAFLVLFGVLQWFLYRKRQHAYERAVFSAKELIDELEKHEGAKFCKLFTESDLKEATSNFSDAQKLGAGGFGTVFVGNLKDGGRVAIKKADHRVGERRNEAQQFVNEIIILSQVNHRNLVRLLGCCLETQVPMLVYEFVSNGDLQEHIHTYVRNDSGAGISKYPPLNWNQRLKISVQTAEALNYLHWGTSPPIYHQDVKCANILLDDEYKVKVADFGLSKLVSADEADAVTRILGGTPGYLDPDFFDRGEFTDKSDVYSFGVVLLVLLTAQMPVDRTRLAHDQNLAIRCDRLMAQGLLMVNLDPELGLALEDADKLQEIHAVAKVALKCVKRYTEERPTMKEVLAELQTIENSTRGEKKSKTSKYSLADKNWSRSSVSSSNSGTVQFQWSDPGTSRETVLSAVEMVGPRLAHTIVTANHSKPTSAILRSLPTSYGDQKVGSSRCPEWMRITHEVGRFRVPLKSEVA